MIPLLNLAQVEPCYLEHCGGCDPCHWGEWRDWSDCDVHCGGGQGHQTPELTVVAVWEGDGVWSNGLKPPGLNGAPRLRELKHLSHL